MRHIIKSEFEKSSAYFYLSTLISVLTMAPQLILSPQCEHTYYLVITLILLMMIPKFSKILFAVFVIFIGISNIIIGHIAMHWGYGTPYIAPRIEVSLLSPAYETVEYLKNYIDDRDVTLTIFTLFTFFLLYRFLRHFSHSYKTLKIIALGTTTAILVAVSFYINPLKVFEPFSIPYEYYNAANNGDYNKIPLERKKFLQELNITKAESKDLIYDKVIVILGESVNKHHMSIYGYKNPTDPFLSSLQKSGQLYVFNAISPTNQTIYSVPIDLTKANVHDYLNLYLHSYSILTDFKENGYGTFWISNQGRVGKYDTSITSMAYEANTTIFANLSFAYAKTDQVLLDNLDKLQKNSNKEMYLLHLMGSHAGYKERYSEDSALYKNASTMDEEYDNSIHYTDYIISEVLKRFKDQKLLLIYLSDHGEVVNLRKNGHGFLPPFKDEYEIPFVIYSNVKNPRLEQLLKENKKGHFNLENFNYMVEYISGISKEKKISFSDDVIAVEPENIFHYRELKFYQ